MVLGTTLSGAAIAIVVSIGLFLWLMFGKPRRKDAIKTAAWILLIGGFFIGGTSVFNELTGALQGFQPGAIVSGVEAGAITPTPPGIICERQTDGTNTVNLVYRNSQNSSLAYLAASVTAEVNGESQDSGTTTAGASLSYLALNVPPCQTGKVYSLASTGQASSVIDYSSYELTSNYEILGASADVIAIQARDSTLAKASSVEANGSSTSAHEQAVSGSGTTDGNAYFTNTSFASGGSLNFYLDYTVNGSTTAYGAMINGQPASDGVILSFDSVDASKWSENALTLTSDTAGVTLRRTACPSSISANRNAEICWETRTLKATDGEIRLRGTLKADLGDPVGGDSPKLCIDDKEFFRDTDGDVKYEAFDSAGTNKGLAGTCLTFVVY